MPLPKPRKDEKKAAFMQRCMRETKNEFRKNKQRVAVCLSQWRRKR